MFKRNKIQPNAPREVLSQYDCIKVIDKPETVTFDGVSFDLFRGFVMTINQRF